jgi:hypothetical protein
VYSGPESLFEFVLTYITDDGILLLSVLEKKGVKDDVRTHAVSYDFIL